MGCIELSPPLLTLAWAMLCRASVTKTPTVPAHGVLTERKTGMEVLTNAAQLLRSKRASGRSGDVKMVDAMMIAQYVVRLRPAADIDLTMSDVNCDGKVTMVDAMLVAQHVVFGRVFECSPCD